MNLTMINLKNLTINLLFSPVINLLMNLIIKTVFLTKKPNSVC